MEKQEQQKFPANQQRIAGKIVDSKLNASNDKLNLTIVTPGENGSGKFLKAFISGADRVANFLRHQEEARQGLPEEKSVHVSLSGVANFAKNGQHSNNTLIVLDKLKETSENFVMPKTANELSEFNSKHHSRAAENNQIKIIGRLGAEPEFHTTTNEKGTSTFATFPFYHNYTTGSGPDEQKQSIQANVVVPTAQLDKFKEVGYEKGHTIKLEGLIQPKSYEKAGEKVYTFNIIARDIIPDLNKTIEESKAAEKSQGKEAATEKEQSNGVKQNSKKAASAENKSSQTKGQENASSKKKSQTR